MCKSDLNSHTSFDAKMQAYNPVASTLLCTKHRLDQPHAALVDILRISVQRNGSATQPNLDTAASKVGEVVITSAELSR